MYGGTSKVNASEIASTSGEVSQRQDGCHCEKLRSSAEAIQEMEKCKFTPTLIMQMGGKGNANLLCVYSDQHE